MFDLTKQPDAHTYHRTHRTFVAPSAIEDRNVLHAPAPCPANIATMATLPVEDPFSGCLISDLTVNPAAHTYHFMPAHAAAPFAMAETTLTIIAETRYPSGLAHTVNVRVDLITLMHAKDRGALLAAVVADALANIGVKL
jgi:hypothetical protein